MSYSNSSLNSFANCMARYKHQYILHTPPCKPQSPHLTFGTMAHDVLHKAGLLRDDVNDGVVSENDYYNVIPSEVLYPELKEEFGISSWTKYFYEVIRQTVEYEHNLVNELVALNDGPVTILREYKCCVNADTIFAISQKAINEPFVGVIDLLIRTDNYAYILDYKFSSNKKTQDDFDINSQLPLYAFFVNTEFGIPVHNIKVGYIDIPKTEFERPILLKNGTLSRSKSQNVSAEMYKKCVTAVHGDDPQYNCKPGGWYYDAYCEFLNNKSAYLSVQYMDEDTYKGIMSDLFDTADLISYMKRNNLPFVSKYDSYTCKGCEFIKACKPWLTVDGG